MSLTISPAGIVLLIGVALGCYSIMTVFTSGYDRDGIDAIMGVCLSFIWATFLVLVRIAVKHFFNI